MSLPWRIGSRSNHGLYGQVAVKDVDFTTGPFASRPDFRGGEQGKIYSVPEEAQVNMQVHASLHLAGDALSQGRPLSMNFCLTLPPLTS